MMYAAYKCDLQRMQPSVWETAHVFTAAVLGPPQMISLVETHDDTHPKPVLINIPPLLWPMVCLYVYSEPVNNGLS